MNARPFPDDILDPLRRRWPALLDDPAACRLQILLTRPAPDGDRTFAFRAGAEYHFPASTVKPSAVIAALALLDRRIAPGPGCRTLPPLPPDADVGLDSPFSVKTREGAWLHRDADGPLTVARLARKICVISDNPAYNVLFDLAGRPAITQVLRGLGLRDARVRGHVGVPRRGLDFGPTPQVNIQTPAGTLTLPALPAGPDEPDDRPPPGLAFGRALVEDGRRTEGPVDFSDRNRLPLTDLHRLMLAVDPGGFAPGPPLPLSPASADFLRSLLTMPPRNCPDPVYPAGPFPDDFAKFFLPGLERVCPTGLSVCSKCGRAYGFTIDAAVVRAPGRTPFALSAVLYTNANGVLGDDLYEYAEVANPFMHDLAEAVARWVWA